MPTTNTTVVQAQTAERDGRSKPRTLIRMLSTKFTPRSLPTLRSPPSVPSAYSKEQREAALRARGLLPPLPNRDLSTQERQQDRHIPVVRLSQEEKQADGDGDGDDAKAPSAADLIKKEWVAKNNANSDKTFKEEPLADVGSSAEPAESRSSRLDQAGAASPTKVASSSTAACELSPTSPTTDRPSSLLADLSDEIQAFMFPLPPCLSPLPSLPQSESTPALQDPLSRADTDKTDDSETSTPAPRPRPPASRSSPDPDPDSPLLRVSNRDSCGGHTEESHSDASIMTPSLDSSTTSQTLSSFSQRSTSAFSAASAAASSSKKAGLGLHIHTSGDPFEDTVRIVSPGVADHPFSGDELGVVIEEDSRPPSPSPLTKAPPALLEGGMGGKLKLDAVERRGEAEAGGVHTHSVSGGTDVDNEAAAAVLSPAKNSVPAVAASSLKAPPSVDRKRSINLFKRAVTVSGAHGKGENAIPEDTTTTTPVARRRLTVGTTSFGSLSNLRRSVVGSLSKTPAKAQSLSQSLSGRGKTFDASHLPPSPPVSPTTTRVTTPIARVRQPQQVVMYNRGSILMEAAGIEDEETRRMTELAFLG